MLYLDYGLKTT